MPLDKASQLQGVCNDKTHRLEDVGNADLLQVANQLHFSRSLGGNL